MFFSISVPVISIHAPHARSDMEFMLKRMEATISIHAPHARSDSRSIFTLVTIAYFNPRSSCEERLPAFLYSRRIRFKFQSTLLMRGAT